MNAEDWCEEIMTKNLVSVSNKNTYWDNIKELGWKRFTAFLVLATIDFLVIGVPYYFKLLVPNIQNYLGVDEVDISRMTALIGAVTLLTQLMGGWLTDKFSSKKLLIYAVLITSGAMFWFGGLILHHPYPKPVLRYQYYLIYIIWGISSTPLFWAPLWKLVSQQTHPDKQGFAFGLQGSLNGFVGIILFCIIGFSILKYTQYYEKTYLNSMQNQYYTTGFGIYIFLLSAILVFAAIGIHMFVVERKSHEKFSMSITGLSRIMANWKVWGLSIFLLGMYMFQSPIAYYLYQVLTNVNKLDPTILLIVPILRIFVLRFAISILISKYSDRIRSFIFLLICASTIALILLVILIFLPGIHFGSNNSNYFDSINGVGKIVISTIMTILFLVVASLSWIMVTLRYPQTSEIHFDKNYYGTVTAVISFIGFSSDAWFYAIASFIQEKYQNSNTKLTYQSGYQIILLIAMVFVLIGLLAGFLVWRSERKLMRQHGLIFYRWRKQ